MSKKVAELAEAFAKLNEAPKRDAKSSNVRMTRHVPQVKDAIAGLYSYETLIGAKVELGYIVCIDAFSYSTSRHQDAMQNTLFNLGYRDLGPIEPKGYEVELHGWYIGKKDMPRYHFWSNELDMFAGGVPVTLEAEPHGYVDWSVTGNESFELNQPAVEFIPDLVVKLDGQRVDFTKAIRIHRHVPVEMLNQDLKGHVQSVIIPFPAVIDAARFTHHMNVGRWNDIFWKLYSAMVSVEEGDWTIGHHGRTAVQMLKRRWNEKYMLITEGFMPAYDLAEGYDVVTSAKRSGEDLAIRYTTPNPYRAYSDECILHDGANHYMASNALSFSLYMLQAEKVIVTNAMNAIYHRD